LFRQQTVRAPPYQLVGRDSPPGMVKTAGVAAASSVWNSMAGRVRTWPAAPRTGQPRPRSTAMSRAWAAEYSPAGVRVNTVAPGPVYTGADP